MYYIEATAYDSTNPYVLIRHGSLEPNFKLNELEISNEDSYIIPFQELSSKIKWPPVGIARVDVQYDDKDAQSLVRTIIYSHIDFLSKVDQASLKKDDPEETIPSYRFPDPSRRVNRKTYSLCTSSVESPRQLQFLLRVLEELVITMF